MSRSSPHRFISGVRWRASLAPQTRASFRRVLLPLLLVVTLLAGTLGSTAQAAPDESRVLPQLQREAREQPRKMFRVIVTRLQKGRGGDNQVNTAGGKKLKDLPHDAFVAELPGRAIEALGRHRDVKFVEYDAVMVSTCQGCSAVNSSKLATVYPRATNVSTLWPTVNNGTGWTGAGVGVAIVDTGINEARRDWNDATGNSRILTKVTFSSGTGPLRKDDGHGHGTHVAGIVGANSWYRTDTSLQGKYVGIAPEADLIDVKVSDDRGKSYISDVVTAIDWVVQNRNLYNIRVMNLSLVSTVAESARTGTLAAAVERAWFNGILVVVASGNSGPDTLRYPPANDPFVITVGASDTMETASRSDDGMAPWSSYGTTQDGYSKPEVVAPGRRIVSPLSSNTASLAKSFPERIVDGSYIWMSGTSMAAPVVSGIAALAFQAHPEWTNDQVKWLLMQTATKLGGSTPLPGQGAGEVNAAAVVSYPNQPQAANQGVPINEQLKGPDGALVYATPISAWSSSSWSSSSWSSSSWSSSSWSSSSWSSSSWSSSNQLSGTDSAQNDSATTDAATTDAAALDIE